MNVGEEEKAEIVGLATGCGKDKIYYLIELKVFLLNGARAARPSLSDALPILGCTRTPKSSRGRRLHKTQHSAIPYGRVFRAEAGPVL